MTKHNYHYMAISIRAALGVSLLATSVLSQAQNSAPALEEILVQGTFISENGQSGLKSDVPLRDVPMTISGYTEDFMNSVESTRVADLYNYMAGVQRAGPTGLDISIRGFTSGPTDRNNMQIDGLPGMAVRFGSPPSINTERIEVVKGPAAVLYGQVQPGGFVNIISKKPQAETMAQIKFRAQGYYGSDASISETSGGTIAFDATGELVDSGKFLYRLVAEYEDSNTFRANGFSESKYVVPSLTWLPDSDTKLTLSLEYRKEDHALDNYLVTPTNNISSVNKDVTTRYQEANDDQPEEGYTSAISFEKNIADGVVWRVNHRYVWHEDFATGYENSGFANSSTLKRRERNQENERTYNFIDTNLAFEFDVANVTNNMLIGFNAGEETSRFIRYHFNANNPTLNIDVYNPVYGQGIPSVDRNVSDNDRDRNFESTGVYLQDQLAFGERWKAVAGLRYEKFDSSEKLYQPIGVYSNTSSVDGSAVTPMLGIIYQPDDVVSLYASYAESFNPPSWGREDANGKPITEPETGWQLEFGAKFDFEHGTATASVFHIIREDVAQNTRKPNINGSDTWELSGEELSEGFEFETNISLSEKLQFIAAYAYIDATINKDVDPVKEGQTLRNAPKHTSSVWTKYAFNESWSAGVGVNYASERYGHTPRASGRLVLPSYTVVDFGVYYKSDDFDATLKFGNVFDKRYYDSAFDSLRVIPGAPANVVFSATKRL